MTHIPSLFTRDPDIRNRRVQTFFCVHAVLKQPEAIGYRYIVGDAPTKIRIGGVDV